MGEGVAILANPPLCRRNGTDLDYPYRPDSDFWYLTGFHEPDAILVLIAAPQKKSILFCTETPSEESRIFNGDVCGVTHAVDVYGFDEAYPLTKADEMIPGLIAGKGTLRYFFGKRRDWNIRFLDWLNAARLYSPEISKTEDLRAIVSEMRLIKDVHEIAELTRAGVCTAKGARSAMEKCRPGIFEYALEAEIQKVFRENGCGRLPAFTSIVAGGANACTLHYVDNNCILKDGDLVLVDIGAEWNYYSGDVSRTFPVNGVFTEPQRALYDVVLDAQKKGINEVRTGKTVRDPHIAASRAITEGLVRLGILSGNVETLLEEGLEPGSKVSFRRFFMHGTGHWLGLDTHDTGDYRDKDKHPRSYKPGMVVTVEPGLYIQPSPDVPEAFWNIGIRIEDDVLVTKGNPRVLTSFVPKEVKAIEALMKKR